MICRLNDAIVQVSYRDNQKYIYKTHSSYVRQLLADFGVDIRKLPVPVLAKFEENRKNLQLRMLRSLTL